MYFISNGGLLGLNNVKTRRSTEIKLTKTEFIFILLFLIIMVTLIIIYYYSCAIRCYNDCCLLQTHAACAFRFKICPLTNYIANWKMVTGMVCVF